MVTFKNKKSGPWAVIDAYDAALMKQCQDEIDAFLAESIVWDLVPHMMQVDAMVNSLRAQVEAVRSHK